MPKLNFQILLRSSSSMIPKTCTISRFFSFCSADCLLPTTFQLELRSQCTFSLLSISCLPTEFATLSHGSFRFIHSILCISCNVSPSGPRLAESPLYFYIFLEKRPSALFSMLVPRLLFYYFLLYFDFVYSEMCLFSQFWYGFIFLFPGYVLASHSLSTSRHDTPRVLHFFQLQYYKCDRTKMKHVNQCLEGLKSTSFHFKKAGCRKNEFRCVCVCVGGGGVIIVINFIKLNSPLSIDYSIVVFNAFLSGCLYGNMLLKVNFLGA